MATNVGNLVASLELRSAQFLKAAKRVDSRLARMENKFASVGRVGVAALGALATAVAAISLTRIGDEALDTADDMSKLTDRLNITTESISELGFVAGTAGIEFRTLALGLQRLERRSAEAAGGTGEAKDAIRELGIDALKFSRLQLDQKFEVVAEALNNVENESDKVRLAFKLFDSEGVALLQAFTNGAIGIRELREEARKLGVTLSKEDAKAAADAKDAFLALDSAVDALTRSMVISLAPALEGIADFLTTAIPNAVFAAENVFRRMVASVVGGFSSLVDTIGYDLEKLAEALQFVGLDSLSQSVDNAAKSLRGLAGRADFYASLQTTVADAQVRARVEIQATTKAYDDQAASLEDVAVAAQTNNDAIFGNLGDIAGDVDEDIGNDLRAAQVAQEKALLDLKRFQGDFDGEDNAAFQKVSETLAQAIDDGSKEGAKSLATNLLDELKNSAIQQFIAGLFGTGKAGGGGLLSGILPGFNKGANFTVGGKGGIDNNVVAFRASKGESVSVSRSGSGGAVNINQNLQVNGTTRAEQAAFAAAIRDQTVADVYDQMRRR